MVARTSDTELSHGAFRLLRVLRGARTYRDGRGRTMRRVGQGYLAARCGHVTKRQIRRYLRELEACGRVVVVKHRREMRGGRWYSLECQAYHLIGDKTAGQTKRTSMSGPRFTGGAGGPAGAHPRPSNHSQPPKSTACGHGDPGGPHRCPLCRRGIPGYED